MRMKKTVTIACFLGAVVAHGDESIAPLPVAIEN
jgi:hypothetical protein